MKNISRRTLAIIAIVLLLGAGIAYGWYQQSQNTIDTGEQTQTEETTDGRIQEEQVNNEGGQQNGGSSQQDYGQGEEKEIQPDEGSSNPGGSIEAPEITRAEQSGDNIRVSAIFDRSSSGNCELVLSKSGYSNVTRTADIIVGPSYYACGGFRVPVSELPAKGTWQAKVIHQRNGNSASSEVKSIHVE